MLTFALSQSHGGWNSDDNQTNNLGRYPPVGHQAPPTRRPIRCRKMSARSSPSRGQKRSPAQVAAIFSYWRTTVPEWKEANDAIESLWRQHPEGSSQFVLEAREMAARPTFSSGAISSSRSGRCRRACRSFLHPLPAERPADTRLPSRGGWPIAARRRPRGPSSTGSGRAISASALSARAKTSARNARRRRTSSCSTGWPWSSWITVGA